MTTVWKAPLRPDFTGEGYGLCTVVVPKGAQFLHAEFLGEACVWFACDPAADRVERQLAIVPTGGAVPEGARHLSTFIQQGGMALVWHVYAL